MLVPVVMMLCITGIIVYTTHLRHRERNELILRGKNPFLNALAPAAAPKYGTKALFFALLSIALGLALGVSSLVFQDNDPDMLTASLLFIFAGVALLAYWKITASDRTYAREQSEKRFDKLTHIYEAEQMSQNPTTTSEDRATGAGF